MSKIKTIIAAGVMMLTSLAANAAGVQLTNSVFKEVERKTPAGTTEIKLVPAGVIVPGDRVLFVMSYKNSGTNPASKVVITNPVPSEVQYVAAKEGGEPVVSVDGGKSFAILSSLTIRNADGTTRPARRSDVTHVRWEIPRTLTPGETGQVSFQGQIK